MPTGAPMTAANEQIKTPYLALERKKKVLSVQPCAVIHLSSTLLYQVLFFSLIDFCNVKIFCFFGSTEVCKVLFD